MRVQAGDIVTYRDADDAEENRLKKARPVLVLATPDTIDSTRLIVAPLYSKAREEMSTAARYVVVPSKSNGLKALSQVGIDNAIVGDIRRCGSLCGRLDSTDWEIVRYMIQRHAETLLNLIQT